MGLSALVAYKMRAGLTILGVVMGIMTVTGMSAIVAGLNKSMATQIEGFGTAVIFVRPQGPGENLSQEERRRRKGLTELEVEALSNAARRARRWRRWSFPPPRPSNTAGRRSRTSSSSAPRRPTRRFTTPGSRAAGSSRRPTSAAARRWP